MRSSLLVCPSCARHVHVRETTCPFCVRPLPSGLAPAPHGPRRQWVGKVPTALALASALSTAGCGSALTNDPVADAGARDAAADDVSPDAVPDDVSPDTVTDIGSDTGADTGSDVDDDGGAVPLYK